MPNYFDSINTPLQSGSTLIEASAGTGKTYTITLLVLRFIVEQNIPIQHILVVTFTNAATEELRDRIRQRLLIAIRQLTDLTSIIDSDIYHWLNRQQTTLSLKTIHNRLKLALQSIDQTLIFTIHGFCQSILQKYALETGQLFQLTLIPNINFLLQQSTDDFWRKEITSRSLFEVSLLTVDYQNPDDLLASIPKNNGCQTVLPPVQSLTHLFSSIQNLIDQSASQIDEVYLIIKQAFIEEKFTQKYQQHFETKFDLFKAWLTRQTAILPDQNSLELFTQAGLIQGLNGHKFRSNKQMTGEQRKLAYLAELSLPYLLFTELVNTIKQLTVCVRRLLIDYLQQDINKQLHHLAAISFDQLIQRVAEVFADDRSHLLLSHLQNECKVGLIDEFQDTDQLQWQIFAQLFSKQEQFLYLIGDPKQAIYKFRGADIYTYFAAQQQINYQYTLAKNWRSHPYLVEAINQLFHHPHSFLLNSLSFQAVHAARLIDDHYFKNAQRQLPPLMLWQLIESDEESGYWHSQKAAQIIQTAVINEIIALLNQYSFISSQKTQKIQVNQIAILVRTNQQAENYQQALIAAGIPAILHYTASVYQSPEAKSLCYLLQALLEPHKMALIKQAVIHFWFGIDGQKLYQLNQQDYEWEQFSARFQIYQHIWVEQGLLAMMQQLLHHEAIIKHLSILPFAERKLTNLFHLLELLQQAAQQQQFNPQNTFIYLQKAIHFAQQAIDDNQQLRLETEADAVTIITAHRAKGLEYDIVFCPLLWYENQYKSTTSVSCQINQQLITDIGSKDFNIHQQFAKDEQLAEEMRLLYVAVTRAKYRCYIAWANVRSKNIANQSALSHLFRFSDKSFIEQQRQLQQLTTEFPLSFDYQLITDQLPEYYLNTPSDLAKSLQPRKKPYYPQSDWQISSYTGLAMRSITLTSPLLAEHHDEIYQEKLINENESALPKGASMGNLIHYLLEVKHFDQLAVINSESTLYYQQAGLRFGLTLESPEALSLLLQNIVSTSLAIDDAEFCLKNIRSTKCLKEMPFYLALSPFRLQQINHILQNCETFQPLTDQALSGYLTGFIDLICEYQGRYYLIDYKSNSLPNYQLSDLTIAMREHNYGLQYWIYSVVLHQYLQQQLNNYDYQRHFGGVFYLFVRGMNPLIPLSGVYAIRPDWQTLQALIQLSKKAN